MSGYIASAVRSDWETPRELFQALDAEFHFTVDVCATITNRKCEKFFSPEQDGLTQNWGGQICWCNPPYGREIAAWVKKAAESKTTVVMLLPARTDTKWFHDFVYGKAEVRFLRGRVRFVGADASAPFPSMIVIFRKGGHLMAQRYRIRNQYEDPQSIEARIVCYCEACGEPICEGYDYYQFGNHAMCESCVDECRTTAEVPEEPFVMEDDDGGMF